MANIIVLGAGMVGSAMARDLNKNHDVVSADINDATLDRMKDKFGIETMKVDSSNEEQLKTAIGPFDLVVNAVPGFMGYQTTKWIIEAGKNVSDISFFPEDALTLDALAKEKGVTAIVDVGVAPGMDNFILGYHNERMTVKKFECLVGGLPQVRKWPFEYKAPFSPVDVIEEYTRPARYVEQGREVVRPPLTDPEFIEFAKVGTLESFNSDGLRSLIQTMPHIPDMKEKTLRYPGHIQLIMALKESGFFSEEKMAGTDISPREFTSKILFDEWKLGDTEPELTVMRVTVEGEEDGKQVSHVWNLYDVYDPETQVSSMSRTTGYTCTAAAELILQGKFDLKGVFPPELVGGVGDCFDFVLNYLKERGVNYEHSTIN